MTLLELRTQFINENGRADLVVDMAAYADNGANYYLNVGQRFLDNLVGVPKAFAWYKQDVIADQAFVALKYLRAAKEVWMMNSDGRFALEKVDYGWMRENYAEPVASITSDKPAYWCMASVRMSPEQKALVRADYGTEFTYGHEDILLSDESPFVSRGILWMPPLDAAYTIEVLGLFFSGDMSGDSDETYWTVVYPEVLLKAANYAIESTYRNREGMRDWEESIRTDILGIDKNVVEEEVAGINQMEE